jgi:hypothetical protein
LSSFLFVVHGVVGEHGGKRNSSIGRLPWFLFYAYYFCLHAMFSCFLGLGQLKCEAEGE